MLLDALVELRVDVPCLQDRKSTRLNSSHLGISYAVFCLKKKKHFVINQLSDLVAETCSMYHDSATLSDEIEQEGHYEPTYIQYKFADSRHHDTVSECRTS